MSLVRFCLPLFLVLISAVASGEERNDSLVELALAGDTETVSSAIRNGADVNSVNHNRASLVFAAAIRGHVELLGYLLKGGADANLANAQGSTPLYAASMMGHTKAAKILLAHGADPNIAMEAYIATPLMAAAVNGRIEIVRMLLRHNAVVDTTNGEGKSVLDLIDPSAEPEMSALLRVGR